MKRFLKIFVALMMFFTVQATAATSASAAQRHEDPRHEDSRHEDSRHEDSRHEDPRHEDSRHEAKNPINVTASFTRHDCTVTFENTARAAKELKIQSIKLYDEDGRELKTDRINHHGNLTLKSNHKQDYTFSAARAKRVVVKYDLKDSHDDQYVTYTRTIRK